MCNMCNPIVDKKWLGLHCAWSIRNYVKRFILFFSSRLIVKFPSALAVPGKVFLHCQISGLQQSAIVSTAEQNNLQLRKAQLASQHKSKRHTSDANASRQPAKRSGQLAGCGQVLRQVRGGFVLEQLGPGSPGDRGQGGHRWRGKWPWHDGQEAERGALQRRLQAQHAKSQPHQPYGHAREQLLRQSHRPGDDQTLASACQVSWFLFLGLEVKMMGSLSWAWEKNHRCYGFLSCYISDSPMSLSIHGIWQFLIYCHP